MGNSSKLATQRALDEAYEAGHSASSVFYEDLFKKAGMSGAAAMVRASADVRAFATRVAKGKNHG